MKADPPNLFASLVFSLAALTAIAAEPPPLPAGGMPRIPPVNSALALEGAALVSALRGGGFVLYIRHTETGNVTQTCETSNLTERGRKDAVAVGQSIRALKLPFDKIISSDVCRALETAKLMDIGPVLIDEDLHRTPKRPDHRIHEARLKLIGTPPAPGKNTLLSGHMQNGDKPEHRLFMDMGEIVVFKPRGDSQADVVARVRPSEWPALIESAGAAKAK